MKVLRNLIAALSLGTLLYYCFVGQPTTATWILCVLLSLATEEHRQARIDRLESELEISQRSFDVLQALHKASKGARK